MNLSSYPKIWALGHNAIAGGGRVRCIGCVEAASRHLDVSQLPKVVRKMWGETIFKVSNPDGLWAPFVAMAFAVSVLEKDTLIGYALGR